MEREDVGAILGYFAAAWPYVDVTQETAVVWHEALLGVDPGDAATAMRSLIKTEERFPSIARFLVEAEAHGHRRRNATAAARGLPAPERDEFPAKLNADLRRLLTEKTGQRHDHSKHEPCPACGGTPLPWQLSRMTKRGLHDPGTCFTCQEERRTGGEEPAPPQPLFDPLQRPYSYKELYEGGVK